MEGRAEHAEDQRAAFLQAVSHDLRNPLIVIEGFASLLEHRSDQLSEADRVDYARRIHDAARRMRRQLNDLLDVDRLTRGVIEPRREPTDLYALAVDTVDALRLVDQVELAFEPIVVLVDAAQVERIIENLVANATRHSPTGTKIWIRVDVEGDGVVLCVDDDGPGVPAEARDRIFEVFQTGSGETGGTGVGLSLVQRFAALHDGRAWVQDRPGGGASFRVHLPDCLASHAPGSER